PRPGGLNITVARNAYGRQLDSFEASLNINIPGSPEFSHKPLEGVFIRAPRISGDGVGHGVEVLCTFEDSPVLVRGGNILGAAFHPELSGDNRLHEWFLREMVPCK
ncbi:MAG: pyridoxal 5'-phosphate synthase glutaminase subunit PdxT, partial [Spirochaetaceae bacterium]|nr:pyridoxal 5'-phosphate synthase glutaminase subunit PdxT [Spirochaetaceae bacterium]